jgi:hypothetical protein
LSFLFSSDQATSSSNNNNSTLPDGSVLIRELAQADNPLEAVNCPTQTPLLHAVCSIHSFIYLLITLGKINQNDVRNLTVNKWGSELGTRVLNDLCKLYMNLIWESSMLLWLCNEEQQQHQLQQLQQFYQLQLQQLSQITGSDQTQAPTPTTANSPSSQLAQLIQQFSTTANNTQTTALSTSATAAASSANFKFNRADLDRLRTYLTATTAVNASSSSQMPPVPPPPPPHQQKETTGDRMETATVTTATSVTEPVTAAASVQFQPMASYSKLLRPLFNCSSKLGRSLCELFGLLVKLSAGSPWKNTNTRRNMIHHLQSSNLVPSQTAVSVATAIANISISGFAHQRFSSFCSSAKGGAEEKPLPFTSGKCANDIDRRF